MLGNQLIVKLINLILLHLFSWIGVFEQFETSNMYFFYVTRRPKILRILWMHRNPRPKVFLTKLTLSLMLHCFNASSDHLRFSHLVHVFFIEQFLILVLRKVSFFGLHSTLGPLHRLPVLASCKDTLMLTWRRQNKIRVGGGIQPYNYKQDTLKNMQLGNIKTTNIHYKYCN